MAEETKAPDAKAPEVPVVTAEQFGTDYALEVIGLCALVNKPDLAAGFIRDKVSTRVIGQKLQEMKAEAQEKIPAVSSHVAGIIGAAEDQIKAQAQQIRTAEGCTEAQAIVQAVNRNPALYDQYLQTHPAQTSALR